MPSNKTTSIIRFSDLEPAWHVPGAKVGGTLRWLTSWVGGPKGHVNSNPDNSVINDEVGIGLMHLPVGQRQEGLHYHTVTEIYVILKGTVVGYDGTDTPHRAGPMDCIYIPAGVPHGVRNAGLEDVQLVWLHDGLEAKGATIYCQTQEDIKNAPSKENIKILSLAELEPFWGAPRAKEPEFLRWMVNWIGGPEGYENLNPGVAVESKKLALGLTVLYPGHKQVSHQHSVAEVYTIIKGKAMIHLDGKNHELGHLDSVYFPAGHPHSLRNHGSEPVHIMWTYERANEAGGTTYTTGEQVSLGLHAATNGSIEH